VSLKKKITLAQIGRYDDLRRHIRHIKSIIKENSKSDLIVFPELILHGHPSIERPEGLLYRKMKVFYRDLAESADDLISFIQDAGARVIFGHLRGTAGAFLNTATYVDRNRIYHYNKTHIHWTENFIPGKRLDVIDTPAGRLGICICYDGAFLEVWRVLALKGADIVINISATPREFPQEFIWSRLQGAAIFNQLFIVYVNRPDKIFSGQSAVINPQGKIIANLGKRPNVKTVTVDLKEIKRWRKKEVIYPNRIPRLYREIVKQKKK